MRTTRCGSGFIWLHPDGSPASARVQEELAPVLPVEEGPPAREVAAQRLGRLASDRDDPLLVPLARAADDPLVEVDAVLLEPDRLAHTEAGPVEELDERTVT